MVMPLCIIVVYYRRMVGQGCIIHTTPFTAHASTHPLALQTVFVRGLSNWPDDGSIYSSYAHYLIKFSWCRLV